MDPERVKALMRSKVIVGKCDTCGRSIDPRQCGRVECPRRRPEMHDPGKDGTTPVKRHLGWDG